MHDSDRLKLYQVARSAAWYTILTLVILQLLAQFPDVRQVLTLRAIVGVVAAVFVLFAFIKSMRAWRASERTPRA